MKPLPSALAALTVSVLPVVLALVLLGGCLWLVLPWEWARWDMLLEGDISTTLGCVLCACWDCFCPVSGSLDMLAVLPGVLLLDMPPSLSLGMTRVGTRSVLLLCAEA